MDLLFLGTSSGTPTKSRNVSGIALIESKGSTWYLIDCGEGTQHQLLHTNLSLNNLAAIFLTHLHGDHCYGLPGLLANAGLNGRTSSLKLIAPKGVKDWLQLTVQMSELHLPYEIDFVETQAGINLETGQFRVSAITLSHRIESFAYCFDEVSTRSTLEIDKIRHAGIPQGPLWGELQAGRSVEFNGITYPSTEFTRPVKPKRLVICGDNDSPELLTDVCTECDLLVHESTFTQDMAELAHRVGHSYAKQIAIFAEKQGIPNLILTHISARYSANAEELENEARDQYTGNLYIASDFQRYRLGTSLDLLSSE